MSRERMVIEAGQAVARAIRSGLLVKPERCSRCGKKVLSARQMHGHHRNYFKPLEVEWMCNLCHLKRHKFLRWFALGMGFSEWCKKNQVNPADRHLPAHHKKNGRPLKLSWLQHWLRGNRE